MKELQNIIHRHFDDPKQKKRYLALLIALSMLVSFMVPLILMEPADSMTRKKVRASAAAGTMVSNLNNGQPANNGYSKGQLSEVELLIGDGVDWAEGCTSAAEVVEAAKMKYFLGIASDFCVFLEGDFEPKDADAEGRVAVGGDVVFEHNEYNYQLGAGDFGSSIPLIDTDNYEGVTNFAHLIMGGDTLTNIATFGTKDMGKYLAEENKDRYKRFVVYNDFELASNTNTHYGDSGAMSYGGDHGHYGVSFSESSQFYRRDGLIDFENVFLWLKEQSLKLGRKSAKGSTTISYIPHVPISGADGTTNFDGGELLTVTFKGPGVDSGMETIYFDLDEWNVDKLTDGTPINEGDYIQCVRFEDVPPNANLVVNCGGEIIRIGAAGDKDFFSTYINGEIISNTGSYSSNNNKKSEQILYNFYECGLDSDVIDYATQTIKDKDGNVKEERKVPYQLFIDCNFNGSILAPNAIVVSDYYCGGHLSGALIAQSFNGGLEFGYRPYRGSTDILGSTAGYAIPFDKFKQGDEKTYLPGAIFAVTETGENGKMVESWRTGETTSFITIPSKVDFAGDTTYTGENNDNVLNGEYIVKEQSAPEGYVLSDKTYQLFVNEIVDVDSLIRTENGTIPTRILVQLEIKDDEEIIASYEMTIMDTYSEDGLIQRIISIENENGKQYFVLDINPEDGSIKSVGVPEDTSVLDNNEAEGALNNLVLYANQIVNYFSSEVPEGEGTDESDETTTTTTIITSEDTTTTTTTTVTSSPFPPGYQEPILTVTYSENQQLSSVTIPSQDNVGWWEWIDSSQNVGDVGTKSFSAKFYPTVSGYTEREVSLQITVEQATPTPPQSYTVSYGTLLSDIQLPSDNNGRWEWTDSNQTGTTTESPYSYEVKYIPSSNNYKAITSSVSVTFTKIDPPQGSYTIPENLTAVYGQTLQDIALPPTDNGRWEWENSGNSVGNVGTNNTHNLRFIPNEPNNYNTITVQVTVEVVKADPSYTVPNGLTVSYGSALSTVKLPDSWSWSEDVNTIITANADTEVTYKAIFTPSDTNNYNTVEKELTVTVVKANPVVNPVCEREEYTQFDSIPLISLGDGSTSGTIKWHVDTPSQLKYGKNFLTWEFTPVDTINYTTLSGTKVIEADPIPTIEIDIDESMAGEFTYPVGEGSVNYYYDPDSIMVMPVPEETPSFVNEYGLVFKKLDENGNLLPGATIQLQSGTIIEGEFVPDEEEYGAESEPKWDWENGTSSTATIAVKEITLSELEEGIVYRFYEEEPPSEEYEKANPIYFKKISDTKIIYTQNENDLADTSKWLELDFDEGQHTISMTDKGVYGANITLVKTNENGVRLDGAKFELYAVGGTKDELVYPLNNANYFEFNNGEVNLYNWFNSKESSTYNQKYVQNGYLKPGGYYLYEVESPSLAYQRPDGPLYFTIEEYTDDDGNTYYEVNKDKVELPNYIPISFNTRPDNSNQLNIIWNVICNDVTMDGGSNAPVIEGVKSIKVTADTEVKLYRTGSSNSGDYGSYSDGITTFTFDTPLDTNQVEFQPKSEWNAFNITNIEIETSSGTIYATSDPNPIPDDYTIGSISVSPITAELIEVRPKSGETNQQWYGYLGVIMDGGSNAPVIEGVNTIKVTAETEVKLYSRNNLTGEAIDGQLGTYSDNITTFTFDSPIDIDKIEFQPKDNGWQPYRITKLEIETSSGKIYTTDQQFVNDMNSQSSKPDLSIKSITVYYLNGDSDTITYEQALSASDNPNEDGSYSFEGFTLENNDEIVGMTLVVEGEGTGSIKIGDAWAISCDAPGTYTVGRTDYQPPESEEEGDTSDLVSVNDTTITIKNEFQGMEADISAVKTWSGDADFKKYRPESIEVKLYRSTYPTGKDNDGKESLEYVGDITESEYADFKENATVILNESNGWKYTWKDLPSIYDQVINQDTGEIDFEQSKRYYYFVKESVVPSMYDVTYPAQGSTSGDYNITNTLKTVNIPVVKEWEKFGNDVTLPDSIEVQLQMQENGNWKNVDNKTITLSKANNWTGTFEDLPSGETYRAVEKEVPIGWLNNEAGNATSSNEKTTLTIKNTLDVSNLNLVKKWTDDNNKDDTRPGKIKFKLYRSILKMSGSNGNVSVIEPSSQKYSTVTEDYARLLQYSLYFYDAQMCGDEVTENSVLDWRENCAVDYQTSTIEGGFHDAGDHLMFGLPQGFTASSLGWTYYEYKDAFEKLGLTDHYKVIMKEFCDFFVNSTKLDSSNNVESFLYQKGAFDEHNSWGPPEQGAYHTNQEWWTSDAASDIAANYAAALAQYVKNFGDPGNYLKYAEALYRYSTTTNKVATDTVVTEGGNDVKGYRSVDYKDEQAWAAAWLYLVTEQSAYKEDCARLLGELGESADNRDKRGYFWGNEELAASCVYNAYIADTADWDMIENYLNKYVSPPDNQGLTLDGDYLILDGWASTRHNALIQSLALAYDKHTGNNKYKSWAQSQMDYILGLNPYNTCFVVGFAENSATSPHHRSASTLVGWDAFNNNPSYSSINGSHTLLGALVGGTHFDNGSLKYTDSCKQVEGNEVALDYNAGLVGAAAALYSVYGSGFTVTEEIMVEDGLELKDGKHTYENKYESQTAPAAYSARFNTLSSMTFNLNSKKVMSALAAPTGYKLLKSIPGSLITNIESWIDISSFGLKDIAYIEFEFEWTPNYSWSGYNGQIKINNDENTGYDYSYSNSSEHLIALKEIQDVTSIKYLTNYCDGTLTPKTIRFYVVDDGPSISITNAPTTALKIGTSHQLSATYEGGTVAWKSSQPDKVSVENGVVNVNSYPDGGKVTITAYDANDETINDTVDIYVEAMTLTANSSNPVIGDKITLESNYTDFTISAGEGYTVDGKTIIPTATGDITVNATCGNASASMTINNVSPLTITGSTLMDVGEKVTFAVNGQKDGHTFTWESSDNTNEKFTIDNNGNAQALASGTYTITVTKDGTYKAYYDVTVKKGALTISLDKSQIRVGGTAELTAFNNDGQTVSYSWSSSDEISATITGNTITAVNPGTLTITGVLGSESDTVNLTVYANPEITAPEGASILYTNQQVQLSASNIIGTAKWTSSNPNVLEVDEATGLVTAKSSGNAIITVEDLYDNKTATYEITAKLSVATVQLPADAEYVTTVELTGNTDEWTKEITNLPKYDGNGNRYYYYVVELDSHDGEIDESTDRISGNGGALYVPTSYENNGILLGDNSVINVSNEIAEIVQGQMPSSGGTGRTTYYFFGGMIMLLSAAGYTVLRRRQSSRREE